MRCYSVKDVGQFFIEGVTDGPMVDFSVQRMGDLISIYRTSHQLYELFQVHFTTIQTSAGLTYPTASQTEEYLNEELTLAPIQPQALKGTYRAGEFISAIKAVYFSSDNEVSFASNSTFETSLVAGVSLNAADPGEDVDVRLFGIVEDQGLILGINKPLFLTSAGNFSLVPPVSGTLTRIGKSLGTGQIFIKIEEPIQL